MKQSSCTYVPLVDLCFWWLASKINLAYLTPPRGVDAAQVKNHWSIARKWRSTHLPNFPISDFSFRIHTSLCHVLQDCQMCACSHSPCRQAYTHQTTVGPTSLIIMISDKGYLYPAGTTAATTWDSASL
jgi:hypothetical protein